MAKRRLWDSTSHSVDNHHPFKALSLGFLLLLTGLISINCASFRVGRPLSSQFRSAADSDETNQLDNLIGQWASSPVSQIGFKALPSQQSYYSAGQFPQPAAAAATVRANHDLNGLSALEDDRQKLYNQLQLLAGSSSSDNYYDISNKNNQIDDDLMVRPVSELAREQNQYQLVGKPNDDYADQPLAGSYSSSPLSPQPAIDNSDYYSSASLADDAIDRKKLLELLTGRSVDDAQPIVRQLSDDYRYLLEQNPKHVSIYRSLDGEPAASSEGDASAAMQVDSPKSSGQDLAYELGKQQPPPQAEPEKRSRFWEEEENKNITLTTLLDDEEDSKQISEGTVKVSESSSSSSSKDKTASTSTKDDEQATNWRESSGSSRARFAVAPDRAEPNRSTLSSVMQATGLSKLGSMLSGLFHSVANNWPASLSLGQYESPSSHATGTSSTKTTQWAGQLQQQQQRIAEDTSSTTMFAKPSVSEPASRRDVVDQEENNSNSKISVMDETEDEERNRWSVGTNNDKPVAAAAASSGSESRAAKVEQQQTSSSKADYEAASLESSEQSIRVEPDKAKADEAAQSTTSTSTSTTTTATATATTSAFESSKRESKQVGGHKISLLRQSANLVVPEPESSDEPNVEPPMSAANKRRPVLEKYIYAPEHHYHLGGPSSFASVDSSKRLSLGTDGVGADDDDDDDIDNGAENSASAAEQMFARMSQRSGASLRQIHAGDDVFADSPFSSLRPFYAAAHFAHDEDRRDRLGLLPGKSNDIYFLVMVAAFCAMAMTVVLAAGLFAYRVQQSRKSSTEAEYPTYGVVGPNNMSGLGSGGKCGGAASFVGGYLTGGGLGGPGSSSSGSASKSGSVKQLADMYSIGADSGIGGATSNSAKRGGGKRVILANEQAVVSSAGNPPGNNNSSGQANRFANQNAARMFHYQHQKQQMIISDRSSNGRHTSASDLDSEDENDENSYTVYECPGLASAHEMEIKNPLFNDDQTP